MVSGRYLKPKPENWLCYGQPEKMPEIEMVGDVAIGYAEALSG